MCENDRRIEVILYKTHVGYPRDRVYRGDGDDQYWEVWVGGFRGTGDTPIKAFDTAMKVLNESASAAMDEILRSIAFGEGDEELTRIQMGNTAPFKKIGDKTLELPPGYKKISYID